MKYIHHVVRLNVRVPSLAFPMARRCPLHTRPRNRKGSSLWTPFLTATGISTCTKSFTRRKDEGQSVGATRRAAQTSTPIPRLCCVLGHCESTRQTSHLPSHSGFLYRYRVSAMLPRFAISTISVRCVQTLRRVAQLCTSIFPRHRYALRCVTLSSLSRHLCTPLDSNSCNDTTLVPVPVPFYDIVFAYCPVSPPAPLLPTNPHIYSGVM